MRFTIIISFVASLALLSQSPAAYAAPVLSQVNSVAIRSCTGEQCRDIVPPKPQPSADPCTDMDNGSTGTDPDTTGTGSNSTDTSPDSTGTGTNSTVLDSTGTGTNNTVTAPQPATSSGLDPEVKSLVETLIDALQNFDNQG